MSHEGPRDDGARGRTQPRSVQEALGRARNHAMRSASEAVAAGRALLDALSLATSGEASDQHRLLATVGRSLDELSGMLAAPDAATSLLDAVFESLDVEIERWERRANTDRDARAVLRAYLGLREILWELGAAPRERGTPQATAAAARRRPRPTRPAARVQRVDVEG